MTLFKQGSQYQEQIQTQYEVGVEANAFGNMCESSPILMPGQQVQHPAMLGLSAFEQAEVVLTGYRDCAAEAIRYLVEEERFAMDDPLVIGLRKHLYEQQRALNIHRILSNLENNPYYDDEIDNTYLDDSGIGETSIGGNGSSMEGSTPSETDSDFLPSGNISNVTPEVDRDAIVSLAEEILSLIELGEEPEEDTDGCPPVDTDDYLMQ